MANKTIKGLTVEIGGDTTKLGKALEDVEKKGRDLSSELGSINKLLKMDPGNVELLAQKQKVLTDAVGNTKEKLDKLKEAEKQVQAQFEKGEASEEQVRALQREIIATTKKLDGYEQAVEETTDAINKLGKESEDLEDETKDTAKGADKAADALDDMEKEAKDADKASGGLGDTLKDTAKNGLAALATAVTGVLTALVGSAEATREYRTEMGKLDTAFTQNGHSSEAAQQTYKSLQGVLGETEQAVEAANHLAKLTDNEKDLQKWTDICTGVYATFGASLPIEGLTEAANETAKTGALTGSLADALNWAGVNEEKFQEQLDACSTEQERQALIAETLNGLYSDAAEKYKETNAEIIRANEANEAWMASMAEIGGVIEPILTDVKLLGASLLSDLVPGIKEVATAFRGMLNGDEGAADALGGSIASIITDLLNKVTDLLPQAAAVAMSLINTLTTSLLDMAPKILQTLITVATQVVQSLAGYLPTLLPAILTAILDIISLLVNNIPVILDAIMAVIQGILTALPTLLETVGTRLVEIMTDLLYGVLPQLMLIITEQLPQMLTSLLEILTEYLPWLIECLAYMVTDLVGQLLPQIVTLLTETLPTLIDTIVNGVLDALPVLLEAAIGLFMAIVEAIPVIIQELIPTLPKIIDTILNAVSRALPVLLDAAIQLFFAILDAIPVLLDSLIPALPTIIDTIVSAVINALPLLLDAAIQLLLAIVKAIPKILPPLVQQLPTIISTITGTLLKNLPLLINAAIKLFHGIIEAIPKIIVELVKQLPSIITAIVKGLGQGVKNIAQVGKDLIKGLWNGIKDMTSWIVGKIKGFGESVLGGIKSFFGIKSPSRVFRDEVGKMLAEGMAVGIEDNADAPLDAMADLSQGVLDEANGLNGLTLERQLNHTFTTEPSTAETSFFGKLDSILAAIERGQVLLLDGDALVGGTADRMNRHLGQLQLLTARGAI